MVARRERLPSVSASKKALSGRMLKVPSTPYGRAGLNATTVPSQLFPTSTTSLNGAAAETGDELSRRMSWFAHAAATITVAARRTEQTRDRGTRGATAFVRSRVLIPEGRA